MRFPTQLMSIPAPAPEADFAPELGELALDLQPAANIARAAAANKARLKKGDWKFVQIVTSILLLINSGGLPVHFRENFDCPRA